MPIAQINGTSLHYHVKGEGIPLVCIHPPLLTRATFQYQIAQLSDRFKVVTFDIRGHGLSAPSESPISYTLITEDIRQLMNELEIERALMCGYSTGNQIALEMMLSWPDRCLGGILLSGMSEMSDVYNRGRASVAASLCRLKRKSLLAYAICKGNADSDITFGKMFQEAMLGDPGSWEQLYRLSLMYNCTKRLGKIEIPQLLMYGKSDIAFYRYAGILRDGLPISKLVSVKGASHHLPIKYSGAVDRCIRDWVDELAID